MYKFIIFSIVLFFAGCVSSSTSESPKIQNSIDWQKMDNINEAGVAMECAKNYWASQAIKGNLTDIKTQKISDKVYLVVGSIRSSGKLMLASIIITIPTDYLATDALLKFPDKMLISDKSFELATTQPS